MAALPDVALERNTASAQLLLRAARDTTQENVLAAVANPYDQQYLNLALWLLTIEEPLCTARQVAFMLALRADVNYRPSPGQPSTAENLRRVGLELMKFIPA